MAIDQDVALVHCAETIKRYQAEIDRLRAALERIVKLGDLDHEGVVRKSVAVGLGSAISIARRALGDDK